MALNDGSWHTINVDVNTSIISAGLRHIDCDGDVTCMQSYTVSDASDVHNLDVTYVGVHFINPRQQQVFGDRVGFVGCVRDVTVNDVIVVPEEFLQNSLVCSTQTFIRCPRV